MKLQGVHDGRVLASHHRTVHESDDGGPFEPLGVIDNPHDGWRSLAYELLTQDPGRSLFEWGVGAYHTTNVWALTDTDLVATVGRQLFSSHDRGATWHHSRELPTSSGLFGVLPTGLCYHDGVAYLGEYPLDSTVTPHVLRSVDSGRNWSRYLALPEVRHIHSIQVDPYTDTLWLSTGDRDEECHIGRLEDGAFEPVVGGDQRFRAVDLVFTPDSILWGMDCLYTAQNTIYRLDRSLLQTEGATIGTPPETGSNAVDAVSAGPTVAAIDGDGPEPQPVTTVENSVYYGATVTDGSTCWAVFSTAVETGGDSTAPQQRASDHQQSTATVLAASSDSEYTDWRVLGRFEAARRPVQYVNPAGRLPCANAYLFLAADDDTLYCNPFNTQQNHGAVVTMQAPSFDHQSFGQSR